VYKRQGYTFYTMRKPVGEGGYVEIGGQGACGRLLLEFHYP